MRNLLVTCGVVAFSLSTCLAEGPPSVDFNRDVRPILTSKCFKCHGPDEEARQADLRLDVRSAATADLGDGRRAVVPHEPGNSELYRRITSADEFELMPPPDSNLALTPAEIDVLRKWIAAGARYEKHWAFIPPTKTAPPINTGPHADWPRNAIDAFTLDRMQRAGLKPSPEADRYTLVRRVYLDLIGLPPTPAEADAFVNDPHEDAYERLVDRLLASPHYGERWGRRWLDLARYSDTNGYEKDRDRSIWPYRDWVIDALNSDVSFDRFTVHQIAGDLLADATLADRVATGFHRNTMINEEGGIDVEEFRFASIVDRVATTGTVWLGLTVGCAQCHTHKYDPITQREYYELFAFLNNADEPEIPVPDVEVTAQRREVQTKIDALAAERGARLSELHHEFRKWVETQSRRATDWTVLRPKTATSEKHATLDVLEDGSVLASGDIPNYDVYTLEFPMPQKPVAAVRLEALPHESLPNHGPGRAVFDSGAGAKGDFLLSEIRLQTVNPDSSKSESVSVPIATASHSHALKGRSAAAALDGNLDTGWSVGKRTGIAHRAVFNLKEPLEPGGERLLRVTLVQQYIHQMTLGRFRISFMSDTKPVEASNLPADVEAVLARPRDERTTAETSRLRTHFLTVSPALEVLNKQTNGLRNSLPEHPTTMIMQERRPKNRRTTHIHHRGEFLKPRDAVDPGTPAVLHPLPPDAPRNRLTLARWLVDPANPLVGRVVVNRAWAAHFGRGLVRTVDDFGTQGASPSHPDLLDWLAVEFTGASASRVAEFAKNSERDGRSTEFLANSATKERNPPAWSLKSLHRLIVTSSTYRQSSHVAPTLLARDADNTLLARGPRVRVPAETVRDVALKSSGLLYAKIGGPGVHPPQPASVTKLAYGGPGWPTSTGPNRYRRGIYTFSKRTAPFAAFTTFDAPSGEVCVARRERSDTPLQALVLLNDQAFLEAARALGKSAAKTAATDDSHGDDDRAASIFRRCLTRPPRKYETDALVDFYKNQLERLQKGELNAAAINGDAAGSDVDGEVQAAWTTVARVLLNLDATITRE